MRKAVCGENWNFLPSGNRVHNIDGGDASLYHLLWIDPRVGVDGLTLNSIQILLHMEQLSLRIDLNQVLQKINN